MLMPSKLGHHDSADEDEPADRIRASAWLGACAAAPLCVNTLLTCSVSEHFSRKCSAFQRFKQCSDSALLGVWAALGIGVFELFIDAKFMRKLLHQFNCSNACEI
jgi:hypothetical protein